MGEMLKGSVSMGSGGGLQEGLSDSMDGYSDTAKTDEFCLGCFLKGFAEGALISLVAVAAIASAPAWLAVTLTVGLAAYGVYGLTQLAANWDQMDGKQKSEAAGGILGGLVGGRFGPKVPPKPLMVPGVKMLATPDGQMIPVMVGVPATAPLQGAASATGATAGAGTVAMAATGGGGGGNGDDDPSGKGDEEQPNTGPEYENPGHHDPNSGPNPYNPTKSLLPANHQDLWNNSVPDPKKPDTRWAVEGKGKDAVFHRFQSTAKDGSKPFHWNGSTSGKTLSGADRSIDPGNVPPAIKRRAN